MAGNVLFTSHLSRLEIYTSCYAMPDLLLLSVLDCFAVYSRIIYFFVPLSPFAPKCLHVIPTRQIASFKLDSKAYSDYGQKSNSSIMLHFPLLLCICQMMGLLMRHLANPGE